MIRTAAKNQTKTLMQKDLNYLIRLWQNIKNKYKTANHPGKIYTEPDLIMKIIRDTSNPNFERIITDDKEKSKNISDFLKIIIPRKKPEVMFY